MARLSSKDEKWLRQYLFDLLPEDKREEIEQKIFSNEALFELLQAIELEVLDEYVDGSLSDQERRGFEQRIRRSKALQESLRLTEVLHRPEFRRLAAEATATAGRTAEAHSWRLRWRDISRHVVRPALATAFLLALVVNFWLYRERQTVRRTGERLMQENSLLQQQRRQSEQEIAGARSQAEMLRQQLEAARGRESALQQRLRSRPPGAQPLIRIPLTPGITRGQSEAPRNTIAPGGALLLEMHLLLPGQEKYRAYRVEILAEGREIYRQSGLQAPAGDESLAVQVPRSVLPPGDYLLVVRGDAGNGDYDFIENFALRVQ